MGTILCSFLYCEKRRRKINSFLYLVLGLFESLIASSVFTWAKLGSWISTIITVMDYVKEIRMRSSNKSLDSQLNVGHKCTIVHWSWHHQSSFHTCIMELPHQWWPREPHHQFLATPGPLVLQPFWVVADFYLRTNINSNFPTSSSSMPRYTVGLPHNTSNPSEFLILIACIPCSGTDQKEWWIGDFFFLFNLFVCNPNSQFFLSI